MAWSSPDDLRAQVQKRWDRGELLAALVAGHAAVGAPLPEPSGKPSCNCGDTAATRSARRANSAASKGMRSRTIAFIGIQFHSSMV